MDCLLLAGNSSAPYTIDVLRVMKRSEAAAEDHKFKTIGGELPCSFGVAHACQLTLSTLPEGLMNDTKVGNSVTKSIRHFLKPLITTQEREKERERYDLSPVGEGNARYQNIRAPISKCPTR